MKVLHISASDRVGGAGIAAYRHHRALLSHGIESQMLVKVKATDDPRVQTWDVSRQLRHRLPRALRRRYLQAVGPKQSWFPFSDDRSELGGSESEPLPPHDIINVQFTSGFIDQSAFFRRLEAKIPIVVTMHDMNPFTGGCHYDMDCGRFTAKCGQCPQLKSSSEGDLSNAIWNRRFASYQSLLFRKARFIANSHWLAGQAKRSSLLRSLPVEVINCGVDEKIFCPLDRAQARQLLRIPADSKVVMFAADSVENERKGGRYLYEALANIKAPLFLVTAGAGHPPASLKMKSLHLGNLDCEQLMALAYNTADVFVIPSIQEAYGQTALEASACGVPVVGFNTGGIPDIVVHGETGLLCPVKDTQALREAIERLVTDGTLRARMGAKGRQRVEQKLTLDLLADKYAKVYGELLGFAANGN